MKKIRAHTFNLFFVLLFVLECISFREVKSQDLHFSQYYNSPLTLNPALTGKINGDFRVAGIHRRQWKTIGSGFITTALTADVNFPTKILKDAVLGVGLTFANDQLGDGIFKNQIFAPSFAIHKFVDGLKRHKVSFGLQPGITSKKINPTGLYYRDEINPSNGNYVNKDGVPTIVDVTGPINYFNINVGAFWTFVLNEKSQLYSGISYSNLTNPKESLLVSDVLGARQLGRRLSWTGGLNHQLTDRVSLMPSFLLTRQKNAMNLIPGFAVGYRVGKSLPEEAVTLTGGVFYRVTDAPIIMGGLKYKNVQMAISYDITTSSLRDVKKDNYPDKVKSNAKVGAFEISLIYVGFLKRALPREVSIPCKFF